MSGKSKIIVAVSGSMALLVLLTAGCGSAAGQTVSPTFNVPDKGNPKLDSQLDQLVRAEAAGNAEEFARTNNIELENGRVRVIIECIDGQLDAARTATVNAGAEIETVYNNLIQTSIPVNRITALAAEESIRLIRLPLEPLPATK